MALPDHRASFEAQAKSRVTARVEDYLDDKFQNAVDLDNLDDLLEGVLKQQELLKQQVIICKFIVSHI